MTTAILLLACLVLAGAVVVLAVALGSCARVEAELADVEREWLRLDEPSRRADRVSTTSALTRLPRPASAHEQYVITRLGEPERRAGADAGDQAVRRRRAARVGGQGGLLGLRRTPRPVAREPQPHLVRDAARGQARPQAPQGRGARGDPRVASAPAGRQSRRPREDARHEARALVRGRGRRRDLRDGPCPAAGGGVHGRGAPRPAGRRSASVPGCCATTSPRRRPRRKPSCGSGSGCRLMDYPSSPHPGP